MEREVRPSAWLVYGLVQVVQMARMVRVACLVINSTAIPGWCWSWRFEAPQQYVIRSATRFWAVKRKMKHVAFACMSPSPCYSSSLAKLTACGNDGKPTLSTAISISWELGLLAFFILVHLFDFATFLTFLKIFGDAGRS